MQLSSERFASDVFYLPSHNEFSVEHNVSEVIFICGNILSLV